MSTRCHGSTRLGRQCRGSHRGPKELPTRLGCQDLRGGNRRLMRMRCGCRHSGWSLRDTGWGTSHGTCCMAYRHTKWCLGRRPSMFRTLGIGVGSIQEKCPYLRELRTFLPVGALGKALCIRRSRTFLVMGVEASKIWWLANNEPQSFRCKSAYQSNCAGEFGAHYDPSVTHLHKWIHWFKVFEIRVTG